MLRKIQLWSTKAGEFWWHTKAAVSQGSKEVIASQIASRRRGTTYNYALELGIINSNQFSRVNRILVEFDLSGTLQSLCQQCVPAGNKTGTNSVTFLLNKMSHFFRVNSNLKSIKNLRIYTLHTFTVPKCCIKWMSYKRCNKLMHQWIE